MSVKTAKLVKSLPANPETKQIIGVYELNPSLEENKFVVVSSVDLSKNWLLFSVIDKFTPRGFANTETYILPSNGNEITNFGELDGSQKGTMSHKEVLEDLGYEVENPLS